MSSSSDLLSKLSALQAARASIPDMIAGTITTESLRSSIDEFISALNEYINAFLIQTDDPCADYSDPWFENKLCDENDPRWAGENEWEKRKQCLLCYLQSEYGVTVNDAASMDASKIREIADALIIIGDRFAQLIQLCSGETKTNAEAMKAIFGDLDFQYVLRDADNNDYASHSTDADGATLITLPEEMFDEFAKYQTIDMEWLITHELGHAFHDSLGICEDNCGEIVYTENGKQYSIPTSGMPVAVKEFLAATKGYYTLTRDYGDWRGGYSKGDDGVIALTSLNYGKGGVPIASFYQSDNKRLNEDTKRKFQQMSPPIPIYGNAESAEFVYVDTEGVPTSTPKYFREEGTYIPKYDTDSVIDLRAFFPNELGVTSHAAPIEGFADTFAHFIRYGKDKMKKALSENDARIGFFDPESEHSKMCEWLNQLINR